MKEEREGTLRVGLLNELATTRVERVIEVTPQKFPVVFASHPDLASRYAELRKQHPYKRLYFYTVEYISTCPPFAELVKADPKKVSLEEVLTRQHKWIYPSKRIAESTVAVDSFNYIFRGQEVILDPYSPLYGVFSKQEVEVDKRYPSATGPVDLELNSYLAYRLALQLDLPKSISTPSELIDFAHTQGIRVDLSALKLGFFQLGARKVAQLVGEQSISTDTVNDLYQQVAHWLLMIAEHQQKYTLQSDRVVSPYPPANLEGWPDVHFLPYLGEAILQFVIDIPFLIKAGNEYSPDDIKNVINNFYKVAKNALDQYRSQPNRDSQEVEEEANSIATPLSELRSLFQNLWELYRKNPALVNRRGSREEIVLGKIPNYDSFREEILKAGARAPAKTIAIRMKYATRKRTI